MELKSDDTGDVYLDVINDSVHTFTVHSSYRYVLLVKFSALQLYIYNYMDFSGGA
jgi:hypothetical protein